MTGLPIPSPLEGRRIIKKRVFGVCLLLAIALGGALAGRYFYPSHVTILPFTYNVPQGSVRFRVDVEGQPRLMQFDTLQMQTALGRRLYRQLTQEQLGMDHLRPSADFAVGNHRAHLFYNEIEEEALLPHTEGIVSCDLFAPDAGFEGRNGRPGARVTLDFKTQRLKLEDGPTLEPLSLPKGTLQAPLLRKGDGPYYLLLPLNNGDGARFALGIGCKEVLLPTGAVLFPASTGTDYVNATGMVPVTLTLGGRDLTALAMALPHSQTFGVLGMSLLANYRVVLDFRSSRLYLEPLNSPSDF